MADFILNWIDFLWLPAVFFVVEKRHRWLAAGFALACLIMMRMQYELLEEFQLEKEGIPGMLRSDPYYRGLMTYSVVIILYILLSHYSRKTDPVIYLAASITIFFTAFILATIIMSL